ncbi:MAG: hypothetical protein GY870_03395, partial [archaeon]|nr:hypothetical protein [archaeon]
MEKTLNLLKKIKNKIGLQTLLHEEAQKVYSAVLNFKNSGNHKFHLRVLKNGKGILIIDASFILYLNHMAMIYLEKFIEGKSLKEIQDFFVKHYRTTPEEVSHDFGNIMSKLEQIITTEDVYPLQSIGFSPEEAFTVSEFPLRVDLAVTYRSQDSKNCYKARDSDFPELDTEGILDIMEKLWKVGVPHIALTGGEPTLREDFMELIEYGQKTGFVMGMLSNGIKFADPKLVKDVVKKGLDYIQIT